MTRLRGLTALVVDDSAAARRRIAVALESLGLETVEADDGAAAWRYLQGAPADIILTDINMPVVDGLKLIALVRGAGPHRRTPIVVITTESGEEDRRRASGLGATAYLVKPAQDGEVVQVVRALLGA